MNGRQELDRLREAFRRKDQSKQNFLIATVVDASPHQTLGYVFATLDDGTPINVQAWTTTTIANGNKLFVAPISNQPWNWYTLIGVNASADTGTTPYTPPPSTTTSLPVHDLDGSAHSGQLPWSRIDTDTSKVDLAAQVEGILPTTKQAKQTSLSTVTIITPSLNAGITGGGSQTGASIAYVRKLAITGGTAATLTLYDATAGAIIYQTGSVSTPFTDVGGWMMITDGDVHWSLTNDGGTASFHLILDLVVWEV